MNGWVKLHRKILENIELMEDDTAYIVFTKLLLVANSKGEIGQSGRDLAEKLNIKYTTLYKCLKRLVAYKMIKQSSKHRYTIIYICNWDNYQSMSKHFGKHVVSTGEAHGKQTTGVPRIENKNKESDKPVMGTGYRNWKKTAQSIKQKSGKIKP